MISVISSYMHQLKNIYLEITLFDFCSNREYYKTVFHFFIFIAAIISWLKSTFKSSAIIISVSSDGSILLEHQQKAVASFLPTCSINHFPVLPFSAKITLNLLFFLDFICLQ